MPLINQSERLELRISDFLIELDYGRAFCACLHTPKRWSKFVRRPNVRKLLDAYLVWYPGDSQPFGQKLAVLGEQSVGLLNVDIIQEYKVDLSLHDNFNVLIAVWCSGDS